MLIGAQLYTIREFTQTVKNIDESFKKIAEIGYTCVQASGFGPISPEQLRDIAEESKLEIVITHTNPDRILDETEKVINEHKTFGCNHIGIGYMPQKYHGSLEGCRAFIKDFTPAAMQMAEKGMKLHYHNHAFEYEKFNGNIIFDVMVNETVPELWGFIPDTYWITVSGRCPAKQLEMLAGRVEACHFKDMIIVDDKQRMAPILEGNLCWDEIFEACKKSVINYAMVEQDDTYGGDPFEALKLSYNNLRKAGFK
jgi:sugar phosphate isomerase/epimerase